MISRLLQSLQFELSGKNRWVFCSNVLTSPHSTSAFQYKSAQLCVARLHICPLFRTSCSLDQYYCLFRPIKLAKDFKYRKKNTKAKNFISISRKTTGPHWYERHEYFTIPDNTMGLICLPTKRLLSFVICLIP